MQIKEVTARQYYRRPFLFVDRSNGGALNAARIIEIINGKEIETGIIQTSLRKNRSSNFVVCFSYKGIDYDPIGEPIKIYELDNPLSVKS